MAYPVRDAREQPFVRRSPGHALLTPVAQMLPQAHLQVLPVQRLTGRVVHDCRVLPERHAGVQIINPVRTQAQAQTRAQTRGEED